MIDNIAINSKAFTSIISYIALITSLVATFSNKNICAMCGVVFLIIGVVAERIEYISAVTIVLMFLVFFYFYRKRQYKKIIICVSTIISIVLFFHKFPGINNWVIEKGLRIGKSSISYDFYLNYDKPIIGILFGILLFDEIKKREKIMLRGFCQIIKISFSSILIVITLALIFGFVEFDPKWHELFILWFVNNLFVVCCVEEIFFRQFLQNKISSFCSGLNYNKIVALLTTSFIFGLFHFSGGVPYILLSTVAGIFYGYAYIKTKNLISSIVVHAFLNTVHFLLFSYPMSTKMLV